MSQTTMKIDRDVLADLRELASHDGRNNTYIKPGIFVIFVWLYALLSSYIDLACTKAQPPHHPPAIARTSPGWMV